MLRQLSPYRTSLCVLLQLQVTSPNRTQTPTRTLLQYLSFHDTKNEIPSLFQGSYPDYKSEEPKMGCPSGTGSGPRFS